LNTYAVDADDKIYDFADILSSSDEYSLKNLIDNFTKTTGFELVILTDPFYNTTDDENGDYAQDFYDYNDFGIDDKYYSGVLILRNDYPGYPFYSIRIFGEAQLYFAGSRTENILDNTSSYVANKEYFEAFSEVIVELNEYYKDGKSSEYKGYKINENGDLVAPYRFPWLIAPLVAGIFTLIYIGSYVSKNKMVYKAKLAHDYFDKNGVNYRVKNDSFLHTTTRSIPRSIGSSGSGSGGSFRGSSGRSSSGGGRRV
jgi:uncharacterized membrane protein YgcG